MMDDLFGPVAANDNKNKRKRNRTNEVRDREAEHARRLARAPERVCELCGSTFKKVQKDKAPPRFCSKTCSGKAGMVDIHAAMPMTAPKPVKYTVYRPLCDCCGVRFSGLTKASRLCSGECRSQEARLNARGYTIANDNRDRSPRPCTECGSFFEPEYGNKRRTYCSERCSKRSISRAARDRRDKRIKSTRKEPVYTMRILARDGWRCQMCGIDTPRAKRGTYDSDAPELDHIMPLSKGGAHANDNVQCLCRSCNALKGDSIPANR